jgi:hypothetical protein
MSATAENTVVAEWPINKRETVRLSIEKYNGVWLINLRKWFDADDGEMRPGKHGIALSVKHLPRLAEAISAAHRIAISQELVDSTPEVRS